MLPDHSIRYMNVHLHLFRLYILERLPKSNTMKLNAQTKFRPVPIYHKNIAGESKLERISIIHIRAITLSGLPKSHKIEYRM